MAFEYSGNSSSDLFVNLMNDWNMDVRPSFDDFTDVYDEITLARDAKKTKAKKTRISAHEIRKNPRDAEDDRLSEETEFCCLELIDSQELFGEKVKISPASEYDDYFRGIDFILSFTPTEDQSPAYLAVDVTVARNQDIVLEKEEKIFYGVLDQAGLSEGYLTQAKYFLDQYNDEVRGELKLPHVILNIDFDLASQVKKIVEKMKDQKLSIKKLAPKEQKVLDGFKSGIKKSLYQQFNKYISYLSQRMKTEHNPRVKARLQQAQETYEQVFEKAKQTIL